MHKGAPNYFTSVWRHLNAVVHAPKRGPQVAAAQSTGFLSAIRPRSVGKRLIRSQERACAWCGGFHRDGAAVWEG